MAKKKGFIVVTHSYAPNPEKTGPDNAWLVTENCEFVNNLKNRHVTKASVIIDYVKGEITKNRLKEVSYGEYMSYVNERYPDQLAEFKSMFPVEEMPATDVIEDLQKQYSEMFTDK